MEVAPLRLPIIPPVSVVRTYPFASLGTTFGRIFNAKRLKEKKNLPNNICFGYFLHIELNQLELLVLVP